ncbi:FecR family protein [Kiloniella sp.]|uniref:FecR family protein n=1 Tax=Kiloniella sp. TaxID=1938587 RepID=UPI003A93D87E
MTDELLIPNKASEWIVLLNDDPDNLSLQRDFQSWLEKDRKHREDWEEVSQTWHLLGIVGPSFELKSPPKKISQSGSFISQNLLKGTTISSSYGHLPFSAKTGFARRVTRAVGFMTLALVIVFSLPQFSYQVKYFGADFVNSKPEVRVLDLEDGSSVTLAPETAIDVKLTEKERRITILSGAAFFEVSKNKTRPFIVEKKNIQTKVLGTAFLVDEQETGISVAVTEGLVQVNHMKQDTVSVQLKPGESIAFLSSHDYKLSKSPIGDIAAWRAGYLKVRDQSLGSVVDQIDHFFNGHIFISNTDVREKRLTGVFKLDQPRKSLRGIASLHGLKVTEFSPWVIVLSKK